MFRRISQICAISLCLTCLAAPAAAGFGDFTYHTTITPESMASPTGFAMASLGGQPSSSLSAGAGTVDAHAGMICLMTESGVNSSDTINAPYTIDLFLTDTDSGRSHTFSLTPAKGLTSSVTFPAVGNPTATTTTDLPPTLSEVVGSTLYSVSADPLKYFSPPGAPEDKGRPGLTGGWIVEVSAAPAPEPGLCGLVAVIPLLLRRRGREAVV